MMDIYDFKNMGHSGFEIVTIKDQESYENESLPNDGVLFEGDLDDAPDCLDYLEITSIDVYLDKNTGWICATIDVDGVDDEIYEQVSEVNGGRETVI